MFNQENNLLSLKPTVPWTLTDIGYACVSWVLLIAGLLGTIQLLNLSIDASYLIIVGQVSLLLPTWYFTIYKYNAAWSDLGLRPFRVQIIGLGFILMTIFFMVHLMYAYILYLFQLETQPGLDKIFDKTSFPYLIFVGGAIIAPLVEELFFRGFVFMGVRSKWGWKWGVIISSAMFALAHVMPTSMLPIFFLGAIFAILSQLSGSIWPAIIIHSANNTMALTAVYAMSQGLGSS